MLGVGGVNVRGEGSMQHTNKKVLALKKIL